MRLKLSASLKAGALCLAVLPHAVPAAWVHFNPADTSQVPKLFSQTGFYTVMASKTVTPEAAPFDVNSALWSDNAGKQRWVLLKPGSGTIEFDPASDYFKYPEGTVFVKLFTHDTVAGSAASRIYWETRVLVNKKVPDTVNTAPLTVEMRDAWYGFSYRWNKAGTDAALVPALGFDTTLSYAVGGQKRLKKWTFPGTNGCNACHRQFVRGAQGRGVLGFFTPQINRPVAGNPGLNQIRDLFTRSILGWSRAAPTETELQAMARWAPIGDAQAPLDLRARAYIAANCSGCHGTMGIATSATGHTSLNYDFHKLVGGVLAPEMDFRTQGTGGWGLEPKVTPAGDTLLPSLIVPGHPDISVLLYRMTRRNQTMPGSDDGDTAFFPTMAQMPPLGVYEEDTVATRVVREWILAMPAVSIRHGRSGSPAPAPFLKGNLLVLPGGMGGKVSLTGIDGRRHALTGAREGYRLPADLPPGMYLLRVGARTFKLVR